MSAENEKLLRRLYEAFVAEDIPTVMELVADDAVFYVQGRNPLAGDHTKAVFFTEILSKVMETSGGTFREEVHDVVAGDEHGIALVGHTLQRDGCTISYRAVHAWHFKGQQLSEFWEFPAQPAFDEAWG